MNQEYRLGDDSKLKVRVNQFTEFLERMFDEEERPYFVSDDACLYDISATDEAELSRRCQQWYGRPLSRNDFQLRIWQLLDALYMKQE